LPRRAALYRPVRLSERQYRHQVAAHLERFAVESTSGTDKKSLRRRADALRRCGEHVVAQACDDCGAIDGRSGQILISCSLRVCPACARFRADELRARVGELIRSVPRRPGFGFYLFTFTSRFDPSDPADLTADAIKRRSQRVRAAASYVWRRLFKRDGSAMLLASEVSPSGAVHAHALYFGPRQDITAVRAAYLTKMPDSPFVNVKRVKRTHAAVREVAKYIVKAASPKKSKTLAGERGEYLHPELAAKVEVALRNARLFDFFGAWRGVEVDEHAHDDEEQPAAERCAGCGKDHPRWRTVVLPRDKWLAIAAPDWKPRFTRSGTGPPPRCKPGDLPHRDRPPESTLDEALLRAAPRWHARFRRWQEAAAHAEQRARFAAGLQGEAA
jgi:hypothetical protein